MKQQEEVVTRRPGDDTELNHYECCVVDVAMCGADLRGHRVNGPDEPVTCVVCVELDKLPCEKCGVWYG